MTISVTCQCRRRLRVDDEFAGHPIPCPYCGRAVAVPPEGGVAVATGAGGRNPAPVSTPGTRRGRSRTSSPAWGPVNALGLISGLLGLAGAAAYGTGRADWGLATAGVGFAASGLGLFWAWCACPPAQVAPFVGLCFSGAIAALAMAGPRPEGTFAKDHPALPPGQIQAIATSGAGPRQASQGDFQVRLISARVGRPKVRDLFSPDVIEWREPALILTIEIRNLSTTRATDYLSGTRRLADNFGTTYQEINLGTKSLVERDLGDRRLLPGRALRDVLIFDRPLERAESLDLELSGEIVGAPSPLRLRIPASAIQERGPVASAEHAS